MEEKQRRERPSTLEMEFLSLLNIKKALYCPLASRLVRELTGDLQFLKHIIPTRKYSTYRVVTTCRLKAPRHLVVQNNLKTFTKYSERYVHTL